ncbi:hypothetical protein SAMN05444679_122111 [Variovorax sp. CF079]|nr:hypothetical protein SAMN05444679_122111 [Variovorax sp. CF079]
MAINVRHSKAFTNTKAVTADDTEPLTRNRLHPGR